MRTAFIDKKNTQITLQLSLNIHRGPAERESLNLPVHYKVILDIVCIFNQYIYNPVLTGN